MCRRHVGAKLRPGKDEWHCAAGPTLALPAAPDGLQEIEVSGVVNKMSRVEALGGRRDDVSEADL
jgi:hypothetical protein